MSRGRTINPTGLPPAAPAAPPSPVVDRSRRYPPPARRAAPPPPPCGGPPPPVPSPGPAPVRGRMFLLQRLQEKGQLSDADLRRAQEAQAAEPTRPLHEILLEKGIGTEMHVLQTLAVAFGLEYFKMSEARILPNT